MIAAQNRSARGNEALRALLAPACADDFLDGWPRRRLVVEGSVERFNALPGADLMRDGIEGVVRRFKGPAMVYGDVVVDEADGLSNRLLVPSDEVPSWLERGAAVEIDFVEMCAPELRRFITRLRQELALPAGCVAKAIVYAGRAGAGLPVHFDAYCNFVMQFEGTKTWRVARNEHVVDPLEHYDLFQAPYVPDELRSYWQGEAVHEIATEDVVLRPGSLLFMPRGEWHATESASTSLALNITFGQPPLLDFLLSEIRRRLAPHDEWRRLAADPAGLDDAAHESLRSELNAMLARAKDAIASIGPDDVLLRHDTLTDQYDAAQRAIRRVMGA